MQKQLATEQKAHAKALKELNALKVRRRRIMHDTTRHYSIIQDTEGYWRLARQAEVERRDENQPKVLCAA